MFNLTLIEDRHGKDPSLIRMRLKILREIKELQVQLEEKEVSRRQKK